jgi:hypothetical protein
MKCIICNSKDDVNSIQNVGGIVFISKNKSKLVICGNCIKTIAKQYEQVTNGLVITIDSKSKNEIVIVGEQKFVGEIPKRQDVECEQSEKKRSWHINEKYNLCNEQLDKKIGWYINENSSGWEVYDKIPCDLVRLPKRLMLDEREWPRNEQGVPLYHKPVKELIEGMMVIAKMNLFDYVWNIAKVKSDGYKFYLESGQHIAYPYFSDEKKCFTISGVLNKGAIAKIII